MCPYTHARAHTHIPAHTHTLTHTHTHARAPTHTHTHILACINLVEKTTQTATSARHLCARDPCHGDNHKKSQEKHTLAHIHT
jgi:hypothetical protein